jgi:hypothetical protein
MLVEHVFACQGARFDGSRPRATVSPPMKWRRSSGGLTRVENRRGQGGSGGGFPIPVGRKGAGLGGDWAFLLSRRPEDLHRPVFYNELRDRFGAPGDFAQAYVIAHEVGHHIQTQLGINSQVNQLSQQNPEDANPLSVRLELQADCFAGVWAHSVYARGDLESGDIEEGLGAAAAVGDDRIQQAATGRIDPESWTHGSAEQRTRWFQTGYESGDSNSCDTFSAENP